ncbi:peptidoglycan-binding protein [Micromonospora sp. NPDC049366]|uniref:peptidoglycan-binding protein n=1 Tax=Micromonospora sp. NPDC049366 TaxID=3364271 RepID=UPI0037A81F46
MAASSSPDGRSRGRARPVALAVLAVVLAAAGAGGALLTLRDRSTDGAASGPPPIATTTVTRTDLSDSRSVGGTLGFGPERVVKGAGSGVVTRLPKVGDTVTRGRPLYWVDDRPVPVLFGTVPLFRPLDTPGLEGSDVRMVLDNLAALGLRTGSQPTRGRNGAKLGPDRAVLTPALVAAIKKWQQQNGLEPTGKLTVGAAVVLPGSVRVSAVKALPGDAVAGELLAVTERTKLVTVPVEATEVDGIRAGTGVVIVLPDGTEVPGRVASVSRTVQGGGADQGAGESSPPKVNVLVSPVKAADVATLDAAAVQVRFTSATRKNVLAVPVGALVALREGGYALQVPEGRLVAVETGMVARGLIEVSGPGVTEGLAVVTAS